MKPLVVAAILLAYVLPTKAVAQNPSVGGYIGSVQMSTMEAYENSSSEQTLVYTKAAHSFLASPQQIAAFDEQTVVSAEYTGFEFNFQFGDDPNYQKGKKLIQVNIPAVIGSMPGNLRARVTIENNRIDLILIATASQSLFQAAPPALDEKIQLAGMETEILPQVGPACYAFRAYALDVTIAESEQTNSNGDKISKVRQIILSDFPVNISK